MIRSLAVVALFAFGTCGKGSPASDTAISSTTPDDPGARLETACTGGVTGGGGGSSVTVRGDISKWSRGMASGERKETFVVRDSVRAATFFRQAEARGLTRTTFSEPSNVTCSLTLIRGDGQRYSVAWPMGSVPPKIKSLVELAKEIDAVASPR
jgi:hypothetical protein